VAEKKKPIEKPPTNGACRPIPVPKPPSKPNSILGVPIPRGDSIPRAVLVAWIKKKINPRIKKLAEEIKYRNKWAKKVSAYLRKIP
jgi:hypothetical protein